MSRGGQANRKSVNSWDHSAIANPGIFMINPQISKLQISTKYSTTLSLNSPKISFQDVFFYILNIFELEYNMLLCKRESML